MRRAGHMLAGAILAATTASEAQAVILYGVAESTYSQDFNTLLPTGTANSWTNDTTIPGFHLFNSTATNAGSGRLTSGIDNVAPATWAAVTDYRSSGGSSSRMYAWGHASVNPTDRALGSLTGSSSTADAGDFLYALVLQNTTGATLTSFTLTYTGEQWFSQFNTATPPGPPPAHKLGFSYLVKSSFDAQADIPTQNGLGAYTADSTLDFISPQSGNSSTTQVISLDGNDAANRVTLANTIDVSWASGDYLILRFWDNDDDGNDQPIGIDDLSFAASVPEPASLACLFLAALPLRRMR